MTTSQIIAELKTLGLDPSGIKLELLDNPRIEDLIADLGTRSGDGDAEAQGFYTTLMDAVNALDG